ncbi:hypothetical protein AGMMS49938_00580 [Fibrobacterales bacterium]|nr:hypothetical protein AGMMS49938_00580 [Fibrobacterales bacterium]
MITHKNKPSRPITFLAAATLISLGTLLACSNSPTDNDDGGTQSSSSVAGGDQSSSSIAVQSSSSDGIHWETEAGGTLRITNNSSKDMVIFKGQTPTSNGILGGVHAGYSRDFDISDDVDDFQIGGYFVLRGITKEEYEKNKTNLAQAKAEYSAMATYGQGKKFSAEISPTWSGDYWYKVTNKKNVGIELRAGSPDGEKIGYLPALATNYALYASTSDMQTVYPVYIFYNKSTQTITSFKPTSLAATQDVGPRPVTDNSVPTILFPATDVGLDQLFSNVTYPTAFVQVQNNTTRALRFQKATTYMKAQNGYDNLNSGEGQVFEIASNEAGQQIALTISFLGGSVLVPVKLEGGETPSIKNGYDYTVTVSYIGSDPENSASYSAVVVEGAKRDITDLIETL